MTKRSGLQCRQSRAKMPKLDITISSSQWNAVAGPSRTNSTHKQQPKQIQQEDMWGDDDDEEYIMLASQVVDKVDANAEMIISQSMNIRDADLSYGRFQYDVKASTQHQPAHELPRDERDGIPPNVSNVIKTDEANLGPQTSCITNANYTEQTKLEVHRTILTEKLKTQRREIENLKETLNKVNEKCQIKEGEVSIIEIKRVLIVSTYDNYNVDNFRRQHKHFVLPFILHFLFYQCICLVRIDVKSAFNKTALVLTSSFCECFEWKRNDDNVKLDVYI